VYSTIDFNTYFLSNSIILDNSTTLYFINN